MSTYKIQSLDIRTASEKEFLATARFSNRMRAEKLPNDPPIPEQEYVVSWQNIPSMLDVYAFIAWNDEQTDLIAKGNIVIRRVEDNQHISEFELDVLPEYRRLGLGKKLLFMLAEVAKQVPAVDVHGIAERTQALRAILEVGRVERLRRQQAPGQDGRRPWGRPDDDLRLPGPAIVRLLGTQHERGVELVGRNLLGQEIQ